jgi:hypothetical protein
MKRYRIGGEVEPAPPHFSTGQTEPIPYVGIIGKVVRRYFYRLSYYYDVMFPDGVVEHFPHEELKKAYRSLHN